jgi:hypothetical protein
MSLQDEVSNAISIPHQLIPWIASDWLLCRLLYVTPITSSTATAK